MFATTFLGHQGWMFQTKRACILVDPLLCDDFGHAQVLEYRVYPPRVFRPADFPKLDAVVLTHEHDDHFDIPSLAKLERSIPIYLSVRSSTAAKRILETMGFTVMPLSPGVAIKWKDLELVPFVGDHVSVNCGDEWDTLPFLVRNTGGSGSFFSMVDITMTEAHVLRAQQIVEAPGIVSWTNNALDWSHMADYLGTREGATQDAYLKMGAGRKLIETKWGAPVAMLFCAGGFSFEGERAWMNEHVFCVDTNAICQAMDSLYPDEYFLTTVPGQTFWMEGNRMKKIESSAPFLGTTAPEAWPTRAQTRASAAIDYAPATGRRALSAADEAALPKSLDEFAGALVATELFRSQHSLLEDEAPSRKLTFALVLRRQDQEPLVFEYAPSACAFVPGDAKPEEAYVAGFECWASDLLAVLRGELGPIALTFGRSRLWNVLPYRFNFDIFGALYRMSHPLRRPAEYLRTYERLWAQSKDVAPSIFKR